MLAWNARRAITLRFRIRARAIDVQQEDTNLPRVKEVACRAFQVPSTTRSARRSAKTAWKTSLPKFRIKRLARVAWLVKSRILVVPSARNVMLEELVQTALRALVVSIVRAPTTLLSVATARQDSTNQTLNKLLAFHAFLEHTTMRLA